MKPITSYNYKLAEIPELRNYNSKTFIIPGTKQRIVIGAGGFRKKEYYGKYLTEFHVKPIHYVGNDMKWHDLDEIASYYGNRNGMVLKEGWENKVHIGYLAWYLKRNKLLKGRGIYLPSPSTYMGLPVGRVSMPLLMNVDFFPDADPETTTMDGDVGRDLDDVTWATIHDNADGTLARSTSAGAYGMRIVPSATSEQWRSIVRYMSLFDTSSIADDDTIDSATYGVVGVTGGKNDPDGITMNAAVVTTTPASNTDIVTADYDQFGTVDQATRIAWASLTSDSATYTTFTLNATGLGNISKTGVTKFGIRNGQYDADNVAPTWNSGTSDNEWQIQHAEAVTGTTEDPKLAVTSSSGAAAVVLGNLLSLKVG